MRTTTKNVGRGILQGAVAVVGLLSALGSTELWDRNDGDEEEASAPNLIELEADMNALRMREGAVASVSTRALVTTEERLTTVTYEAQADDALRDYISVSFEVTDAAALEAEWTLQLDPRVAPGAYDLTLTSLLLNSGGGVLVRDSVAVTLDVDPPDRGPAGPSAIAISAGSRYSLALMEDGTVWSWGANRSGQLAENGRLDAFGEGIDRYAPAPIDGLANVVAVTSGGSPFDSAANGGHALALLEDGSIMGWGSNAYGQVGGGDIPVFQQPVRLGGIDDAVAVAAGLDFSLALLADGTLLAWGRNDLGQLGDGTTGDRSAPAPVIGLPAVRAIAAGESHALALAQDGTVWAWGKGSEGAVAGVDCCPEPFPVDVPVSVPVQAPNVSDAIAVWASSRGSFAMLDDGRVLAWGAGTATAGNASDAPRILEGVVRPQFLGEAGGQHVLAIVDGQVSSWGINQEGQLGDGTDVGRTEPLAVPGLAPEIIAAAAGANHSLAIQRRQGCSFLWSWGQNDYGQLGDGVQTAFQAELEFRRSSVNGLGRLQPHLVNGIGEQDCSAIAVITEGDGTVTSADGELTCLAPICTGVFDPGQQVTLTAQPGLLQRVEAWGGDCAGAELGDGGQVQLLADRHQTCTVSFTLDADANPPPVAAFLATPSVPEVNQPVTVDAAMSSDDSAIVSYEWDFQDDGTFDTTGPTATTAYTQVGTFSIRLRVTDDDGLTDETTQAVTVVNPGSFFSLGVEFTGVGEGMVEVSPLGIVLPDAQYCVEGQCTIDLLPNGGVYDLIPRAEGLNFFIGWIDEQCDAQNFFTGACTVVLTGNRTVTAEFLSE